MGHTAHSVVDWTAYLTHPEVDALQELARSLPENPQVVNIGAGNGTSALAFLEARPDLVLWTVDKQLESSPYGCLEGERVVLESAGFYGNPRYQQVHGDSVEVGASWAETWGVALDLVFVDGGHFYHEAKADIEVWLPLLNPGGIMAVHDYGKIVKPWPGVVRAVNELLIGTYEEVLRVDTLIAFKVDK